MPHTPRTFSGIQPSGGLTLGNYLGALERFVHQQHQRDSLFCVVDLHAITVEQSPEALRAQTRAAAAAFLAAGIDPSKATLFVQSHVPAHAELGWMLSCVARVGWMDRMTQFKDKGGANAEAVSLGLYAYPALMAADILAYQATHVPVGADQKQHVELARDIAARFNRVYGGALFPIPEPIIEGPATRVMSLRDGSVKMSKSDPSDASRINLTDSDDAIARKIRRAKTDPAPLPEHLDALADRPEARNLVQIYAALARTEVQDVLDQFAGQGFGPFKAALADLTIATLAPIRTRMAELLEDEAHLDAILAQGARKANAIAAPVVAEAKARMGMLAPR